MKKLKNLAVIPARLESSRFPGKPLKHILGIPMIAHCYERALLVKDIQDVYISTPNPEIINWCQKNNIQCILTSDSHNRATERAQETLLKIDPTLSIYNKVLLIQGDEPETLPEDCDKLLKALNEENEVCNLVCQISKESADDKNIVKAVISNKNNILFFSRNLVPHHSLTYYRQLGLIGFLSKALSRFCNLEESKLEKIESIDMLRFIENGVPIKAIYGKKNINGVDLEEHIKAVESSIRFDKYFNQYRNKYII